MEGITDWTRNVNIFLYSLNFEWMMIKVESL
jgi:hypothetical protein